MKKSEIGRKCTATNRNCKSICFSTFSQQEMTSENFYYFPTFIENKKQITFENHHHLL